MAVERKKKEGLPTELHPNISSYIEIKGISSKKALFTIFELGSLRSAGYLCSLIRAPI